VTSGVQRSIPEDVLIALFHSTAVSGQPPGLPARKTPRLTKLRFASLNKALQDFGVSGTATAVNIPQSLTNLPDLDNTNYNPEARKLVSDIITARFLENTNSLGRGDLWSYPCVHRLKTAGT
jgi:hypothetical protein